MQTPYVGQNVWFTPVGPLSNPNDFNRAAIITKVWSQTMVNVAWFDSDGVAHNATSVNYSEDPNTTQATWRNIVAPI